MTFYCYLVKEVGQTIPEGPGFELIEFIPHSEACPHTDGTYSVTTYRGLGLHKCVEVLCVGCRKRLNIYC